MSLPSRELWPKMWLRAHPYIDILCHHHHDSCLAECLTRYDAAYAIFQMAKKTCRTTADVDAAVARYINAIGAAFKQYEADMESPAEMPAPTIH